MLHREYRELAFPPEETRTPFPEVLTALERKGLVRGPMHVSFKHRVNFLTALYVLRPEIVRDTSLREKQVNIVLEEELPELARVAVSPLMSYLSGDHVKTT